jgi:superfamily I DNA/RNA helicase
MSVPPDDILPVIESTTKLFLSGPYGSGKTEYAVQRLLWLLSRERVRGDDILVLLPQRTIAQPYYRALRGAGIPAGSPPRIATVAGLAREAVALYWPLLSTVTGFANPRKEPTFLNFESAQYHMERLVGEAIANSEFDAIRVDKNRIIIQILENLNTSALHGFTIDEAYARLEQSVPLGESRTGQINALRSARTISHKYRALCLEGSLVDFSLMIELFYQHALNNEWSRVHLFRSHRHIIYDNIEESNAVAHDLIAAWMPNLESALLVMDEDAGYRQMLGADPTNAQKLAELCERTIRLISTPDIAPLLESTARRVDQALRGHLRARDNAAPTTNETLLTAFQMPERSFRFYPQMIRWTTEQVARLIQQEGVAPGQIAIVAPFVSDALRFSIQHGLAERGIPSTSHRPSRALEDEPAVRCLLTLAALAHPDWGIRPPTADVTHAIEVSIPDLDPIRANVLSSIVYPPRRSLIELTSFDNINTAMQERITFVAGEAYQRLRDWLYAYRSSGELLPLDQFFARLFGELLSQPGFGFHNDYDAARVANQLVQSARNFRWALEEAEGAAAALDPGLAVRLGKNYLELVNSGVVGALYIPGWQIPDDAVFLAPAYSFLMRNRMVDVQFWLDIGSNGWWERLYQPLTHPHVLSRNWPANQPWTDFDEFQARQETMRRIILGLIRRTRREIYLGISDIGESGMEQRGPLINLVNQLLVRAA